MIGENKDKRKWNSLKGYNGFYSTKYGEFYKILCFLCYSVFSMTSGQIENILPLSDVCKKRVGCSKISAGKKAAQLWKYPWDRRCEGPNTHFQSFKIDFFHRKYTISEDSVKAAFS